MTTPTTPKAGDITEEFMSTYRDAVRKQGEDNDWNFDEAMDFSEAFMWQALAKQKESIKEQLRMEKKKTSQYGILEENRRNGFNQAVQELNKKLDNL